MTGPEPLRDLVPDYQLYDVPTVCRTCGQEFTGKAFRPADDKQRFGVCETCASIQDAPKLPKKPDLDLRPPRRVFGEDD